MIKDVLELVNYLLAFHRGLSDSPGLDAALLPDDLPDGLRLIYCELGALVEMREPGPTPFAGQDGLMPLSWLKRIDGMIEFVVENQNIWTCRCPIGRGDPPVYSNAPDTLEFGGTGFQKVCDSLNHFLITLCLQEAVMSAPCLLALSADSPADVLNVLYSPVWLGGYYVYASRVTTSTK
jgi:hypothetical protein